MITTHAPATYRCPICLGVQGIVSPDTLIRPTDVVYQDELVTAFINSFFVGVNSGHVIVVPNEHYESIHTLPSAYGHRVFDVAQKIALAMKDAYQCDGITTRQNNEPAGDQHPFHYHFHIFPRYNDDGFNAVQLSEKRLAGAEERAEWAERLRGELGDN
ncbi:HIT family protein [Nocardia sp. CA-107356]|uniref:HIT family protein n=1 Tax=Nocardia sp. CA-107356 TaxID=3239972 RepID=UPI003D8E9887